MNSPLLCFCIGRTFRSQSGLLWGDVHQIRRENLKQLVGFYGIKLTTLASSLDNLIR